MVALHKPPSLRTEGDVAQLAASTCQLKVFKTLPLTTRLALLAEMSCELVAKDSPLTTQGEEASCWLVLYRGGVKVYVSQPERNWSHNCVGAVEEGEAFGELGLIAADGRRTATVLASEPSIIFTLPKPAYNRILRERQAFEYPLPYLPPPLPPSTRPPLPSPHLILYLATFIPISSPLPPPLCFSDAS